MKPRGPQNASKTIFGSKLMIFQKTTSRLIKLSFFIVGGLVWEFKIAPKRFRKNVKNNIGQRGTKRNEKKSTKSDRRLSVKTSSEPGGRSGRSGGGGRRGQN